MIQVYFYLIKKLLYSSGIVVFIATTLVFLFRSFSLLSWIDTEGIPVTTTLYASFLSFGELWLEIIPFTIIISTLFVWNNIHHNKELLAMSTIGISPIKIYSSIITLGCLFSFLSYFLTFYFIPNSYYKFYNLRNLIYDVNNINILQTNKFTNASNNIIFHIKEINSNKLESIFLYIDNKKNQNEYYIYAEQGYIEFIDKKIRIFLKKANIQEYKDNQNVNFITLDTYIFDFSSFYDTSYIKDNPREYNLNHLLNLGEDNFLQNLKKTSLSGYQFFQLELIKNVLERIYRIITPLFLSLITTYFLYRKKYTRYNNSLPFYKIISVSVLFKLLGISIYTTSSSIPLLISPIIMMIIVSLMIFIQLLHSSKYSSSL